MSLQKALQWRYAAKRMTGEKVPKEKVEAILEAARLAPTSMGMQPFHITVIENTPANKTLLEELKLIAENQQQIVQSSHVLIFSAWTDVTEEHIEAHMQNIMRTRGVKAESLKGFRNSIRNFSLTMGTQQKIEWAARQAYIAFSFAIAEAALQQVDTTPMEGFRAPELDRLLGLREKGLTSICLLPLGYRDERNDFLAGAKKVRRESAALFTRI